MTAVAWRAVLRPYGIALGVPLVLTVGLLTIGKPLSDASAAVLYQLGVVAVAMTAGLLPSMLTALLNMLAFHFIFVPAYYSFKLESGEDLLRLVVFLAVAVATSGLTSRARTEAETARRRAAETASLYELSQLISAQVDLSAILPTIARTACQLLAVPRCMILLAEPDGTLREHSWSGEQPAGDMLVEAALREGPVTLGAMRITLGAGQELAPDVRQLLDTLASQASLAISRARLVQQVAHTEALVQSDQLKSALIASVSHDLRTPLATIKGAATTLQASDISLSRATRLSLVRTIEREADTLDRTVENLLDMSRLETGQLQLTWAWNDLSELIGAALQRLEHVLGARPVRVRVDPALPLVLVNAVLLEHVLVNLLENAAKYTPPDSPIDIDAAVAAEPDPPLVVVTVRDYGPGIPPEELEAVFAKFYRGVTTSQHRRGSGLGLTICRGIIVAHGGTIQAANCAAGGAAFILTLPFPEPLSAGADPLSVQTYEDHHGQDTRAPYRG